jgi:dihydrofolate synthase/folylpolyglutamate synthase
MLGRHQADNFAGALAALDVLRELGWNLPQSDVNRALAECAPLARLQILSESPLEIVDTAHNPASIDAALNAIDEHFREIPRVIVFASSRDKDYRRMLELLLPRCQHLVLTAYQNNPRALPVAELLAATEEQSQITEPACQLHQAATPAAALRLAESLAKPAAGPEHLILATGSFFLAAELLPCFDRQSAE